MKMLMTLSALVLLTSAFVVGQRPSFAGTRPIGFPETPNRTTTTQDPLGNRFGEGSTERLPLEANGDRDLIDRLSKLPIDAQPFWFINWQALEAHRQNPQTYPQRPNVFVDPIPQNTNTASQNGIVNRFSPSISVIPTTNTGILAPSPINRENGIVPTTNTNSGLVNKNGGLTTADSIVPQRKPEYNSNLDTNTKAPGHKYV